MRDLNKFNICLDLGNDSLKVSYSFFILEKGNPKQIFGKIVQKSDNKYDVASSIPCECFYDKENHSWLFGNDLKSIAPSELDKIVKITYLLQLIDDKRYCLGEDGKPNADIINSNANYFYHDSHFPLFIYPVNNSLLKNRYNFKERVNKHLTFIAKNNERIYTPKDVVIEYFKFVKEKIIDIALKDIEQIHNINLSNYHVTYSLVHPYGLSKDYIDQYQFMVKKGLNISSFDQDINAIRALSYHAWNHKKVKEGDSFLIFDIGDETISVTKAAIEEDELLCDGVDAHSKPMFVGGKDIDQTLFNYIVNIIDEQRESIGSEHYDKREERPEVDLYLKQYQAVQDIKSAKVRLSSEEEEYTSFSLYREVMLMRFISKDDLLNVTIKQNAYGKEKPIFDLFYKYIHDELARPVNKNVNKIFLAGGVSETLGFYDYINIGIKGDFNHKVEVNTLDLSNDELNDYYNYTSINSSEDVTYAACLGANYISLENINIKVGFSYTYGTYVTYVSKTCFFAFAYKGQEITDDNVKNGFVSRLVPVALKPGFPDYLYTINLSKRDIINQRVDGIEYINILDKFPSFVILDNSEAGYKEFADKINFKKLPDDNGNTSLQVRFSYKINGMSFTVTKFTRAVPKPGKNPNLVEVRVNAYLGLNVDKEGKVRPKYIPCEDKNQDYSYIIGKALINGAEQEIQMIPSLIEIEPLNFAKGSETSKEY